MQKIFIVVLAVCAFHNAVAWPMQQSPDPFTNAIAGAKQAINTINWRVSNNMMNTGSQIASAKLQLLPPLKMLQAQVDQVSSPCATGVQVLLSQIWVLVNNLEQCRLQQQHNVIRNADIVAVKLQMNLVNQLRGACNNQADYIACVTEAAGTLEAKVASILKDNEGKMQGLANDAEKCVTLTGASIHERTEAASEAWEAC